MNVRQTANKEGYTTPFDFQLDLAAAWRYVRLLGRRSQITLVIMGLLLANIGGIWFSQQAHAVTANMILFWDKATDGTTPPAGWCFLTTYDGYFPRGASVSDTVANWGTPFAAPNGTGPYTPSVNSITVSQASANTVTANGSAQNSQTFVAGNLPSGSNPTVTISPDDNGDTNNPNIPAFTNLALIEYGVSDGSGVCTGSGSGIPNVIPANAIAMFNGTSIPSGWSTVTAATNKMIRIGASSCGTHCGGDSITNTVVVRGLTGDGTGTTPVSTFLGTNAVASNSHTHAPPSALNCTSGCSPSGSTSCTRVGAAGTTGVSTSTFTCVSTGTIVDPPYVQPLLAKAGSATPTLSLDLTAMFDDDPGSGWVVLSDGGAYSGQFIRPTTGSANLTSAGNATRPAQTFTGTTGNAITASINTLPLASTAATTGTHNHTDTITTSNATNSNIPPYFNVVVAQKVNFTLQSYKWYVDPCPTGTTSCGTNNDVSDAWPSGSLDIAASTGLPAVPAPYNPPDAGDQTLLRLRVQILVSGVSLATNNVSFALQYAKTNYADCVSDPGNWTTLANSGGGGDWTYGGNSVTDNSTIANRVLGSTISGIFSKSNMPSSNPNAASVGSTLEYDWLIKDSAATGATQYAFRPVQLNPDSSITLLSYYGTATGTQGFNSTCPIVVTRPSSEQVLRHGEFFQTNAAGTAGLGSDQGFVWAD